MKSKTSSGVDNIPMKLIKLASKEVAGPLSDLIDETINNNSFFPSSEKFASVTPLFKKADRLKEENYRPVSVLNVFENV